MPWSSVQENRQKSAKAKDLKIRKAYEMEYKRDRIGNVPFGLHDSRIQKIEFREDSIILKIDRIFQYANNDEEKWYPCEIEFTKADLDCCDILVFNHLYGYEGVCEFTGRELSIEEFINEYPNAEFEIITETYFGYDTVFQGQIWDGEEDLRAIMSIWNMGDMIYRIDLE